MRSHQLSDKQVDELQQRLDEVEDDIDDAERKARDLQHRDTPHWYDSGDNEEEDDQTIAPPG